MSGEQITNLDGMSPAAIAKATREGRLDDLLSGRDPLAEAKAEWRAAKEAAEAELAAATEEAKPVDQGARGVPRSGGQVTAAELQTMSPGEIMKAQRQGRLTDLLG